MEEYLKTISDPMERGRVRKALERQMRLNGKTMWRWEAAEYLAKLPMFRYDETRGRVYTTEDNFFDVSSLTLAVARYAKWLLEKNGRTQ